ncbi:hypothetical protein V502_02273 [Pseudogymnoascus sp. VKM F-4520 (FW-2644)]|nr:hypothetical protein V502_02273 [Pseudogymnoascus sp. VKM F-4520 (FW-2644)]
MTLTKSTTFAFDRLPTELRLQIWWLTVKPRQVVIWQAHRFPDDFYFRYTTFPVALHVCRESRNELLEQYIPLPLPRHDHPGREYYEFYPSNGGKHYMNYVNFAIDTVVFPFDYDPDVLFRDLLPNLHLIQYIAISLGFHGRVADDIINHLRQLPSLKSIYVIVGAISEDEFKLYDPSARYKLYLDGAPPGYSWKSLLASYRGLIAYYWKQETESVPFQGVLACQEPYALELAQGGYFRVFGLGFF